ncbi:MAG: hypothetical protein AAF488_11440 [Planctomycetota bacterium]
MKLYVWAVLFGAIVFGMGWVTHQYTRAEKQPSVEEDRERPPRRGGRGRLRSIGPHIANVQEFAAELELSAEQLDGLDALVRETAEAVQLREAEIRTYLESTRGRIDDLLTEEQLTKLTELNDQRWQHYRDRRVEAWTQWLAENSTLPEESREQARQALTAYMDGFSQVLRSRGRRSPEAAKEIEQLTAVRDEALRQLLSPEVLAQFLEENLRRGSRGDRAERGGRGGDRRWDRRRGRRGEGDRPEGGRRERPPRRPSEIQETNDTKPIDNKPASGAEASGERN